MGTLKIVLLIIQLLSCVTLTAIILLQTGKSSGLSGAIGGGADSYTFQAKSKTFDAKLARWTKWIALVFILLTFALCVI